MHSESSKRIFKQGKIEQESSERLMISNLKRETKMVPLTN